MTRFRKIHLAALAACLLAAMPVSAQQRRSAQDAVASFSVSVPCYFVATAGNGPLAGTRFRLMVRNNLLHALPVGTDVSWGYRFGTIAPHIQGHARVSAPVRPNEIFDPGVEFTGSGAPNCRTWATYTAPAR